MKGKPAVKPAEGYVKFTALHRPADDPAHPFLGRLDAARTRLFDLGLVGMNAGGVGFGNLSIRDGAGFIISGSGTGGARELGPGGYCRVLGFDLAANSVTTAGPVPASSESMSHGAVYGARASAACVLHVHNYELWARLLSEGAPATPADAPYGSPQMATAIAGIVTRAAADSSLLVMAGHEEGVIAWGPSIEAALAVILEAFGRRGPERKDP